MVRKEIIMKVDKKMTTTTIFAYIIERNYVKQFLEIFGKSKPKNKEINNDIYKILKNFFSF